MSRRVEDVAPDAAYPIVDSDAHYIESISVFNVDGECYALRTTALTETALSVRGGTRNARGGLAALGEREYYFDELDISSSWYGW